ncbi:hypothetical protein GCM10009555_078610 [Acrocarpospora macrocephala]|uniref:Uncharacterized protein n=1 Tax=Acrocarpospora macrocephala TaxID=150177 RepID=A0A5M3X6J5_9ACTN|nr:hypothetical protein Amac_098600 [Acrocarpospora macrocephala]
MITTRLKHDRRVDVGREGTPIAHRRSCIKAVGAVCGGDSCGLVAEIGDLNVVVQAGILGVPQQQRRQTVTVTLRAEGAG